jgi:hypothetical protein
MVVKTMNLKGNEYAPVDERLKAFHKDNSNCSITTETSIKDNKIIEARAIITPNVCNPKRVFTGSALGILGKEKALEKLETVAVGRALAFAGYLADGKIASSEEMERFEANNPDEDNSYLVSLFCKLASKIEKKGGYIQDGEKLDFNKAILAQTGKDTLLEVEAGILKKAIVRLETILNNIKNTPDELPDPDKVVENLNK